MDNYKQLLTEYYKKYLNREPDKEGFSHYLSLLERGELNEEKLANEFINCPEYKIIQQNQEFGNEITVHRDIFFNFISELNDNNISYYFMRGFTSLPEKPDTDIDLVCKLSDWDKFTEIASTHLVLKGDVNHGFAEYCDMLYYPYFTPGKVDNSIPNGRFRIDSYNCLHVNSPLNNFETRWTLPEKFNDYIFDKIVEVEYDVKYYIPSAECELVLLVLRDIFDLKGSWKKKHIDRINFLKPNCDKKEILKCVGMVLPNAESIVECIYNNTFDNIFNLIMRE